jgi:histidine triad (HIT) family protein
MNDCIFCKIVSKEIPAEIFYENEHIIAFLDIKPINPGHSLIVPKKHTKDIFEASDETLAAIAQGIKHLGTTLKKVVGADGLNVGVNNGESAGQIVFHLHTHLIPRFKDDGLKSWERGDSTIFPDKDELLEKIKKSL